MDFHKLTRRELQALCKTNKIPANMTNVAMADALKGLDAVQGIQEFLQPTGSETTESAVESPAKIEEFPPTAGRSTRRRNAAKEDPETMKPVSRVRTDRKKALETSPFKILDSDIKQCVEEEKKDLLTTPAPLGVTSRRGRFWKEESMAQRVHSTRRSTRLAEKTMGAVNNAIEKDVSAKHLEYVMVNLTEGFDYLEQMSGTRGEECKRVEEKDEPEDFSSEAPDASVGKEASNKAEADGSVAEVKMDIHAGTEEQYWFDLESKAGTGSMKRGGTEEFDDDRTITLLTEGSQAQDTNGKHVAVLGIEEYQKYDLEEKASTVQEVFRDEDTVVSMAGIDESHGVEGVTKDLPFSESKITFGNTAPLITDVNGDGGKSSDVNMECAVLASGTEISKKMLDGWKIDSEEVHEETATSAKQFVNECRKELNSCLANEFGEDKELTSMLGGAISVKALDEEVKEEDDAVSVKAIDGIVIVHKAEKDIKEIVSCEAAEAVENSPMKHAAGVQGEKGFISQLAALDLNTDAFEDKDAPVVARIPINGSAAKASLMKKETKHVASDINKENIDGGGSLVLAKERAAAKLNALSMRKLSKMLKDKLQITNDHNKKKNEDEVPEVRQALQALGENQ